MNNRPITSIELPWRTILKVLLTMLAVYVLVKLESLVALLLVSIFVALAFDLMVKTMMRLGLPRPASVGLLILGVASVVFVVGFFLVPALLSQLQTVGQSLPALQQGLLDHLPDGQVHAAAARITSHPEALVKDWPEHLFSLGSLVLSTAMSVLVALVFAFYFLVDGARAFDWMVTFFQPETQSKLRETGHEASSIVGSYVTAQVIMSGLVAVFSCSVLMALKVPGALLLAVFAGVAEVLPIVGVMMTISLATLMALVVGANTALWVFCAFLGYLMLENYAITPLVYGKRMELSNLVVLMAVSAGGILAGVIGVLMALPIVAAYPAVERIWLRKYLGEKVVRQHEAMAS